ncbi:MAG: DUF58 domain-containing protein [Pseudomonadota bacterium]
MPAFRSAARSRVRRWAEKRQGPDANLTVLKPRRVYIVPTGVGLIFGLMAFAMLLGSMNYNNNLSFVLTFMLVGIGFVSMHSCQRNLVGLELKFAGVDPVFAGDTATYRFALKNRSRSARRQIHLDVGACSSRTVDLPPGESAVLSLAVDSSRRGYVHLPRFAVRTRYPFDLFRAWAWLHMDLKGLVYPALPRQVPQPPASVAALGHRQHDARGEEDFAGLREFHRGDSPRNVAWKAYARSGQLLAKQFSGADTSSQWFDFDDVPAADTEARLSILARWIVDADRRGEDYALRLPGESFPQAHGPGQRLDCLEALALFELGAGSSGAIPAAGKPDDANG